VAEYLMRDESPLTQEEWDKVDEVVIATAKQHLVGRRFIPVFGPFGVGMQTIFHDVFSGASDTSIDMTGDTEGEPLGSGKRDYKRLPLLYKDFQIHWRDIESSHEHGVPFDVSLAAASAYFVAKAEDDLIFHGSRDQGIEGLLNAPGRQKASKGDWEENGAIFADVVKASQILGEKGFYGPYALAMSAKGYAQAARVYGNTGRLELDQIKRICDAGVFRSEILGEDEAVLVSTGAHNMDLAISQDLVTAYMDTENMNHLFRVFESLTLRIKRAGAICTFE